MVRHLGTTMRLGAICYNLLMTVAQQEKQIEAIVERKLLEFLGDPDEGLKLRPSFVAKLRKSMKDGRKSIPHSVVMKRYGLR